MRARGQFIGVPVIPSLLQFERRPSAVHARATGDDAFWPIATEFHVRWYVGGQGKSGLVVLNVRFVARDAERKSDNRALIEVEFSLKSPRARAQPAWQIPRPHKRPPASLNLRGSNVAEIFN